jgi:serine/threonine-protein kinase
MGEVYLAQHPRLPRLDALKILPEALTDDEEFRARFRREADLAASLWHPHIVGVHDRGEFNGNLWISMDYVDGTDAAGLIQEHYPTGIPESLVIEIVTAVADALDFAHEHRMLHRDVKPANILLTNLSTARRRILLTDFGIARNIDDVGLTANNKLVASAPYAAPEQLMGEPLDGRADQYALAATAFNLFTGTPPFHHSNSAVVIGMHLNSRPPALSERRAELAHLDAVLSRALAKTAPDRYRSCTEFAEALKHPDKLPTRRGSPTRLHDVEKRSPTRALKGSLTPPSATPRKATPSKTTPPSTAPPITAVPKSAPPKPAPSKPAPPHPVPSRPRKPTSPHADALLKRGTWILLGIVVLSIAIAAGGIAYWTATTSDAGSGGAGSSADAPDGASLKPNNRGEVFLKAKSEDMVCAVTEQSVVCGGPFSSSAQQTGPSANQVKVNANGALQWAVGDMDSPSGIFTLTGQTYRALGWTIIVNPSGVRFSNDRTKRGMLASITNVTNF